MILRRAIVFLSDGELSHAFTAVKNYFLRVSEAFGDSRKLKSRIEVHRFDSLFRYHGKDGRVDSL